MRRLASGCRPRPSAPLRPNDAVAGLRRRVRIEARNGRLPHGRSGGCGRLDRRCRRTDRPDVERGRRSWPGLGERLRRRPRGGCRWPFRGKPQRRRIGRRRHRLRRRGHDGWGRRLGDGGRRCRDGGGRWFGHGDRRWHGGRRWCGGLRLHRCGRTRRGCRGCGSRRRPRDRRLDDDVARPADQEQVLDAVAPHQHQPPGVVDIDRLDEPEAALRRARPVGTPACPPPQQREHQENRRDDEQEGDDELQPAGEQGIEAQNVLKPDRHAGPLA